MKEAKLRAQIELLEKTKELEEMKARVDKKLGRK